MARFRVRCQGSRGEVSRLGHRRAVTHCDGWGVGVTCVAGDDPKWGDTITISLTGGSNGITRERVIGKVQYRDGEVKFLMPPRRSDETRTI